MPDYKRKKQTAAGLHLGKKGNIIRAVCKSAGAGAALFSPHHRNKHQSKTEDFLCCWNSFWTP